MNASYKIGLIAAFAIAVVVIGWALSVGDDESGDQNPDAEQLAVTDPQGGTDPGTGGDVTPPGPPPGGDDEPSASTLRDRSTETPDTPPSGDDRSEEFDPGSATAGDPDEDRGFRIRPVGAGDEAEVSDDPTLGTGDDLPDLTDPDSGTEDLPDSDTSTDRVASGDRRPGMLDRFLRDTPSGTSDPDDDTTDRGSRGSTTPPPVGPPPAGSGGDEPTSATPSSYTVQPGDTMSGISLEVYGTVSQWQLIAKANPDIDPRALRPGQELAIPPKPAATTDRGAAADDLPAGPGKQHEVQPGETLSDIAQEHYGRQSLWGDIYEANKSRIGDNPNRLRAGMVLIIPPASD